MEKSESVLFLMNGVIRVDVVDDLNLDELRLSKIIGVIRVVDNNWRCFYFMSYDKNFSSIRTVRVHKEQFDAINKKANAIILTCIEDGRVIVFNNRSENKETDEIIEKLYEMIRNDMFENSIGYPCALDRLLGLIKDRLETVNEMS